MNVISLRSFKLLVILFIVLQKVLCAIWEFKLFSEKPFDIPEMKMLLVFHNTTLFTRMLIPNSRTITIKKGFNTFVPVNVPHEGHPKGVLIIAGYAWHFEKVTKGTVAKVGTTWNKTFLPIPPLTHFKPYQEYNLRVCSNDTYGIRCDQNCHCFDVRCDETSGQCYAGCIAGYHGLTCHDPCSGGSYGAHCLNNCSCSNNRQCHHITGKCPGKCSAGYYGQNCEKKCRYGQFGKNCEQTCNCASDGKCNAITGICDSGICKIGYIGPNCQQICSPQFYGKDCLKQCHCYAKKPCNHVTGICNGTDNCILGYYGKRCDMRTGCKVGFFGKLCKKCGHCKPVCTQNVCDYSCDALTGHCPSGHCLGHYSGSQCMTCDEFHYGRDCKKKCGYCALGTCEPVTGHCDYHGCLPGYLGIKCDLVCRNGYYGSQCVNSCPKNCAAGLCNFTNGFCACKLGWKGPLCDQFDECVDHKWGNACLNDCGHCLSRTKCIKTSGHCPDGCDPGYHGQKCVEVCQPGMYGENCNNFCGTCQNWEICDRVSGNCTNGCMGHFIEPRCHDCHSGWFGHECIDRCGHCKNNATCHPASGVCENGCEKGFTGHFCTERSDESSTLHNLSEN